GRGGSWGRVGGVGEWGRAEGGASSERRPRGWEPGEVEREKWRESGAGGEWGESGVCDLHVGVDGETEGGNDHAAESSEIAAGDGAGAGERGSRGVAGGNQHLV